MPPKRVPKAPEPTDRVTRHSASKQVPGAQEPEERPSSASSSTSTLVHTAHPSDIDTSLSDFHGWEDNIDTTSTQNIESLLRRVTIPLSPDTDDNQFFGTAHESSLEMAGSSDDVGDVDEVVVPIPALPGISPDLLIYFQLQQQAAEKRDKRLDNERRDDLQRHREEQERRREEQQRQREETEAAPYVIRANRKAGSGEIASDC